MLLGLLFAFPLNVSAVDGTENIITSNLEYTGYVLDKNGDESDMDVSDKIIVSSYNNNYISYKFPLPVEDAQRLSVILSLVEEFDFNSSHEYSIKFKWRNLVSLYGNLQVCLFYYDSSGTKLKEQILYSFDSYDQSYNFVDFDFKPDTSDISGSYNCELVILYSQTGYNSTVIGQGVVISDEIEFIDKDDDSGWFQKILNKINDVWESIKALPDKIEASFTAVGDGIVNGIRKALEWAFVPSEDYLEGFADSWQTWFESHFGVFSQVTNFLVDMIGEFEDLFTGNYAFVFPEVSVPIIDKNIVLIEEQTVDIAQWLEAGSFGARLYDIYTTCVWAIIIYCVMKYALVVQDIIFSGTRMVLNET